MISMLLLAAYSGFAQEQVVVQPQPIPGFSVVPKDPALAFEPEQSFPVRQVFPEDVVPGSVRSMQNGTNEFFVRLTYTEAGAKKMLAFNEENAHRKICIEIGAYMSPPEILFPNSSPDDTNYLQWKSGWLKHRTETFFLLTRNDLSDVLNGLHGIPPL
ncbi:MAG TPA: hypothetical protein VNU95_09580, partial [Candidatus Acidoferrales bacterium]|nr:hypothetical protein [Candidatus Acidoferrales bacterium]